MFLRLSASLCLSVFLWQCCGCGPADTKPVQKTELTSTVEVVEIGTPLFEDVTRQSGFDFQYRNGEDVVPAHLSILESLGGGLGVIDFDLDGRLDLFVAGGGHFGGQDNKAILGHPCRLYRNLGGFRFEDVSSRVGLNQLAGGKPWFYSHGVAVADYDRDGWPDILVSGWGRLALFHNEADGHGGRKFSDVSAKAGVDHGVIWTTSIGWADFDGDGHPDFYACQYTNWSFANHPKDCNYGGEPDVCPPKRFQGLQHLVYRNNGDGTFTNVCESAGLRPGGDATSKGLGLVIVDANDDGKPDVYVANDTVANFYYINRSTPGKIVFSEEGSRAGVAFDGFSNTNGSMGTDAGDPARSGKPWLFCTNYENEFHALYRNASTPATPTTAARDLFLYATPGSGMGALGQKFVGWGTGFVDLDRDGWEDIVIVNGHAIRYPITAQRKQKPAIMSNSGQAKFKIATTRGGSYFHSEHLSRGLVLADFDNDGRIDMAVANMNEPGAILKNCSDDQNHWIGFHVIGNQHGDCVGTKIQVVTKDGVVQSRFLKGGGSYASSPDRRLHFGLGSQKDCSKVIVVWPDRSSQEFQDVTSDKYYIVTKGETALRVSVEK